MGLNTIAYGASKKKIESVASGFDHAVRTSDNTFSVYFTDGTHVDLTIPLPEKFASASIDANEHLILTLSDGTNIDSGKLPKAEIKASTKTGNILEVETDGSLYVSSSGSVVSKVTGNIIENKSDGLYVGKSKVEDLADVTIATPSDDESLVYNSTSQKWENKKVTTTVSQKTNNAITNLSGQATTTDNGLYVEKVQLKVGVDATGNDNDLTPSVTDGKIDLLSSDTGNILVYKNGLYVPSTSSKVSQKSDNAIVTLSGQTPSTDDGLYVKRYDDGTTVNGLEYKTDVADSTHDGLYVKPISESNIGDLKDVTLTTPTDKQVLVYDSTNSIWKNADAPKGVVISQKDDNENVLIEITGNNNTDDGLYVQLSANTNNALAVSTTASEEGLLVENETVNLTYDVLFDSTATETTPNHGSTTKEVSTDYLYKQFSVVIPKIMSEISDIFDLTQNIQYVTLDTYADLQAVDLSTYTSGIVLFLVKQDSNYVRVDGNAPYYTTIYIMIPQTDPTTNTYSFVAKLNMSEKMLENAFRTALFVDYYTPSTSGTTGAKVVVADGTMTDASTEIELSTVTSATVLPKGTTISVGDYVLYIDANTSTITKFIKRSEIEYVTASDYVQASNDVLYFIN